MNNHTKHSGEIMGGCKIVRDLYLPPGKKPKVEDDEFSWQLPSEPDHWFVLKKDNSESDQQDTIRLLRKIVNDPTTDEDQREEARGILDLYKEGGD